MKILLAVMLATTAAITGCGDDAPDPKAASPEPSTITVTASPSASPTPTVTVTAEVTVTATATQTVSIDPTPASPASSDVTAAYVAHARSAGMPARQLDDLVRATLTDGALDLLTTMEPGWGGWDCAWEPRELSEQPVQFSRVLYGDGTVFRLCN